MGEISDRFCEAESAKNPHTMAVWDKISPTRATDSPDDARWPAVVLVCQCRMYNVGYRVCVL